MNDISEFEIKERRSKVVPLMMGIPNLQTGGTKMVQIGQQWNAIYEVPPEKTDLIPTKGSIAPGFSKCVKDGLAGNELEKAKQDDLFLPRVKDVQDKGKKDGNYLVVLHIAQAAPFAEGVENVCI